MKEGFTGRYGERVSTERVFPTCTSGVHSFQRRLKTDGTFTKYTCSKCGKPFSRLPRSKGGR